MTSTTREADIVSNKVEPPFRADHVGSLLRPAEVHEARARAAAGAITAADLRAVEDDAIATAVARLADTGIRSLTDGEFRRAFFHLDFLEQVDGVAVVGRIASSSDSEHTVNMAPPKLAVTGPIGHSHNIQVDDYRFLASVVAGLDRPGVVPKVCIPSPTTVHFRGGRAAIDIQAYPDMEQFFADLAAVYQAEIAALCAAGCRYLQLDDTNLAYLCDPAMRRGAMERGDDPDALPAAYAELVNAALAGRPDDLTVGIHLCRGNFRSTWFASGGYEPVAEVLFNQLEVDAYFLEYDDERSGDFAPLRHVPADKTVVLGLMTSKRPELETYDELAARVAEAAASVPMGQLCLSPQCGFASTVEGNALSADQQWAKLEHLVTCAERIWA
jgi:5-methyltetrahydropteroyltriglutamate--homocysteine methyltransferase